MYSDRAGDSLVEFVNDLGRKWSAYANTEDGPYDVIVQREHVDLTNASVVSGLHRNNRYTGD